MRISDRRHLAAAVIAALAVMAGHVRDLRLNAQEVLGPTGLSGAGSTFVYPLLARWSRAYRDDRARGPFPIPEAGLDDPPASSVLSYEPIGSLGGMLRVKDRAVDFAASEVPLQSHELAAFGLGQFPLVFGGIVVAVNVDGVRPGEMRITGPLLASIFLGNTTRWSDPAIRAVNPQLVLPDAPINVIHRADGSGTTFNFTEYLSRVSPEWKARAGAAMLVRWPVGTAAKGNEGVARAVSQARNSIGYVEFAQALQSKLTYVAVQNRSGRFVVPHVTGFSAAAATADWRSTRDFYMLVTDAAGDTAYPLTTVVYIFMHTATPRAKARAAFDFFRWTFEKGSRQATELGYVPLSDSLANQRSEYWARTFRTGN